MDAQAELPIAAATRVPAQLVLEDETADAYRERVALTLWVPPPAGLTRESEQAAVRQAAIALLERAIRVLKGEEEKR